MGVTAGFYALKAQFIPSGIHFESDQEFSVWLGKKKGQIF